MLRMTEAELSNIGKRNRAKPAGPKEGDIQRSIMDYLRLRDWFVVKIHQSLGSYKGIADLVATKDGVTLWIEVKTPSGKQSEHQKTFESDIVSHGGRYMVARSVDEVMKQCSG